MICFLHHADYAGTTAELEQIAEDYHSNFW